MTIIVITITVVNGDDTSTDNNKYMSPVQELGVYLDHVVSIFRPIPPIFAHRRLSELCPEGSEKHDMPCTTAPGPKIISNGRGTRTHLIVQLPFSGDGKLFQPRKPANGCKLSRVDETFHFVQGQLLHHGAQQGQEARV